MMDADYLGVTLTIYCIKDMCVAGSDDAENVANLMALKEIRDEIRTFFPIRQFVRASWEERGFVRRPYAT